MGWTIGHVALSNHVQGVSWLDAQPFLQLEITGSPVHSRRVDHVAGRLPLRLNAPLPRWCLQLSVLFQHPPNPFGGGGEEDTEAQKVEELAPGHKINR